MPLSFFLKVLAMLESIFLAGVIISFLFLFVGLQSGKSFVLGFAAIILLITGLLVASGGIEVQSGQTVSYATNTSQANYTVNSGSYTNEYTVVQNGLTDIISYALILFGGILIYFSAEPFMVKR